MAARHEHRNGLGLGKARQVIKVAVLAVAILNVTAARTYRRCGQNGDAARAHHTHQLLAPAFKFGAFHGQFIRSRRGKVSCLFIFVRMPDIGQLLVGQLGSDPDIFNDLSIRRFVCFIIAIIVNSRTRDLQHIPDDVGQRFRSQPLFQLCGMLRRYQAVQKSLAPVCHCSARGSASVPSSGSSGINSDSRSVSCQNVP